MGTWRNSRGSNWTTAFLAGALLGRWSAGGLPPGRSGWPGAGAAGVAGPAGDAGAALTSPHGQPARRLIPPGAAGTGPVPVVQGAAVGPPSGGMATPIQGRVFQMNDGVISEPVQYVRGTAAPVGAAGIHPMRGGEGPAGRASGPPPALAAEAAVTAEPLAGEHLAVSAPGHQYNQPAPGADGGPGATAAAAPAPAADGAHDPAYAAPVPVADGEPAPSTASARGAAEPGPVPAAPATGWPQRFRPVRGL